MLSAAFKGLIVLKENTFMSTQNVYYFKGRHTCWYLKNFCSVKYKWYEHIFFLFYLLLNCLLMGHLAIMRMWFTLTPLWPLTSVPCCGFKGFGGTMSRLHWLWFSASIELVLSNVISPHFSVLRKEISKKKDIQFQRQHIHMYLTWGGGYWDLHKAYMYCCVAMVRLDNMVKIYVILLFYFLFKICTIGNFFLLLPLAEYMETL